MKVSICVNHGYGAIHRDIIVPDSTRIEGLLPVLYGNGLAEVTTIGLGAEVEGEYLKEGELKDCTAFGRYYKLLSADQVKSICALSEIASRK